MPGLGVLAGVEANPSVGKLCNLDAVVVATVVGRKVLFRQG